MSDQAQEDFVGCGDLFGDEGHLPEVTEIRYGPVRSVIVSPTVPLGCNRATGRRNEDTSIGADMHGPR